MKYFLMILFVTVAFAAADLDDEIIQDLDFFQNMELVKDEDTIKMTEEIEQFNEINEEAGPENEKT